LPSARSTTKLAAPRPLLTLAAFNCRRYPSFSSAFVTVAPSRAASRLGLFSRHLEPKPFLELNTPFSTERSARLVDDRGNIIKPRKPPESKPTAKQAIEAEVPAKMSSQAPHPALLIPGPIEFDDEVLQSMSHYRYASMLLQVLTTPTLTSAANPTSASRS
jgi:alanine-glyoxylate transaminase / serine-glyoxylate transaminase / serine-pyruvate transaminase